ncbi:MAG: hypothetical protein KF690_11195 [Bacteroidetes bacterium]|nr:hypothetical protein [Bacteroidota bacterium]
MAFKPNYSKEVFTGVFQGDKKDFGLLIPMVCFCDIPLSSIKNHLHTYGGYAIGLRREWRDKHLNPILYLNPKHEMKDILAPQANELINRIKSEEEVATLDNPSAFSLVEYIKVIHPRHTKSITSKLDSSKFTIDYEIYEEREWRYVPNVEERVKNSLSPIISFNKTMRMKTIKKYNSQLHSIETSSLSFNVEDISMIIVKTDDDVARISQILTSKFQQSFTGASFSALLSRITSLQTLLNDI